MPFEFTKSRLILPLDAIERGVIEHEYANNTYSLLAYYLSKFLAELPFQILFPTIFSAILYWIVGLDPVFYKWLIFTAILIIAANIGQSIGLLAGALFTNPAVANGVLPMMIIPFVLFGGLFLNQNSTPKYFIWIQYISFFYYSMESLTVNEFKGLTFSCTAEQRNSSACLYQNGQDVLNQYDYKTNSIGPNFAYLIAIFCGIRILGYLVLMLRFRKKK